MKSLFKFLRPMRMLRRRAITQGLFGGNSFWMAFGGLAWVFRWVGRLLGVSEPTPKYTQVIEAGDRFVMVHEAEGPLKQKKLAKREQKTAKRDVKRAAKNDRASSKKAKKGAKKAKKGAKRQAKSNAKRDARLEKRSRKAEALADRLAEVQAVRSEKLDSRHAKETAQLARRAARRRWFG